MVTLEECQTQEDSVGHVSPSRTPWHQATRELRAWAGSQCASLKAHFGNVVKGVGRTQRCGASCQESDDTVNGGQYVVEFVRMVVQPGDTLSRISSICDTPVDVLQRVNGINDAKLVKAGQALLIPRRRHLPDWEAKQRSSRKSFWNWQPEEERRVLANWGDSLWSLADDYSVTIEELRAANNLPEGSSYLYLGQELTLPPRKRRLPGPPSLPQITLPLPLARLLPPPQLPLPKIDVIPVHLLIRHHEGFQKIRKDPVLGAISAVVLRPWKQRLQLEPFCLPVQGGWLSSHYGWKDGRWYFHNGIDIAVERGTEVKAVASGRVTWADWKGGYGKTIQIDHGDGFCTLYAHCDDLVVKQGQIVRKGQCVGLSGNTGYSTGPHLHFEIHKDGQTVEPLDLIPAIS